MSVVVSNKKFVGKATINPEIYDIDEVIVYSYLPQEPGYYYRKLVWDGSKLEYRTQLDSYTVYTSGTWVALPYKTIVFGPNMMLSDEDYAWLTSWADYVGEDDLYTIQKTTLTSIADMIRYQNGSNTPLNCPDDFVDGIAAISDKCVKIRTVTNTVDMSKITVTTGTTVS